MLKGGRVLILATPARRADTEVATGQRRVTSQHSGDPETFSAKIMEEIAEGRHSRRGAA